MKASNVVTNNSMVSSFNASMNQSITNLMECKNSNLAEYQASVDTILKNNISLDPEVIATCLSFESSPRDRYKIVDTFIIEIVKAKKSKKTAHQAVKAICQMGEILLLLGIKDKFDAARGEIDEATFLNDMTPSTFQKVYSLNNCRVFDSFRKTVANHFSAECIAAKLNVKFTIGKGTGSDALQLNETPLVAKKPIPKSHVKTGITEQVVFDVLSSLNSSMRCAFFLKCAQSAEFNTCMASALVTAKKQA